MMIAATMRRRLLLLQLVAGTWSRVRALCLGTAQEDTKCRHTRDRYEPAAAPTQGPAGDFGDLAAVLRRPLGLLAAGLPSLNVTYMDGTRPVSLRGAATRLDNSANAFLGREPELQWDLAAVGGNALVVFLDPDCGGRRANASAFGWCGPALHSMWHDCVGATLGSCTRAVRYNPPGVSRGTNRYAWVLFRQARPLAATSRPVQSVANWDLQRFVALNQLTPVAWNFMFVHGRGAAAWKRLRVRPLALRQRRAPL